MWWWLVPLIAGAALIYFWDDIRQWLIGPVLDWVGSNYGYHVRNRVKKAVVHIDRVATGVRRYVTLNQGWFRQPIIHEDYISINSVPQSVKDALQSNQVLVKEFVL